MTHVLIVEARFYEEIADELYKGAVKYLNAKGVTHEKISVPGAFEIPAAIKFASAEKKFNGFIALGCVIRGETSHYDYVCGESARGLNELAIKDGVPIGYGILTTENMEQAKIRADVNKGDKGAAAAEACLTMIEIKNRFKK